MKRKSKKMRFFLSIIMSAVLTCSLIPLKAFADVTLPSTASYVGYVQSGKTYYIRNHLTASYLSAPSGASVGSSLALGTCTPSSDRYKWTLQQIGTTQYFKIVNKQYPTLCIDQDTLTSNTVKLRLASASYATSKWKLVIQTGAATRFGTIKILNSATTPMRLADTENATDPLKAASLTEDNGYASWIFEEVLSDRNNAAPPISHNYTYASQGYKTGHLARDVATVGVDGIYNFPLYADKAGYLTYWSSISNNQLTRIANFATIKHTGTNCGTMYAHMSAFSNGVTAPSYSSNRSSSASFNPIKQNSTAIYVKRGQLIGFVGNTGTATGYHLHVEYTNNYSQLWEGSGGKWAYAPSYSTYALDPRLYMKLWWSAG